MVLGRLIVVVKIKNVISRKPRSTMGVRSTRVESFLLFFTPGLFLWALPEMSSSAMGLFYANEMRGRRDSIKGASEA